MRGIMRRSAPVWLAFAGIITAPGVASAADAPTETVTWGLGIATLLASVALLLIALGLARVAAGSAMADNISYVVAACVCLAGAVLAAWWRRLVSDPAVTGQIELAGTALNTVSIVLFCVYFYRVRAALKRFLRGVSGDAAIPPARVPEELTAPSSDGARGEQR